MDIQLKDVTEKNFFEVIALKSDKDQEKYFQIYERWVGSNAFFLAACQTFGFKPRAVYDGTQLIGFASHGFRNETGRHELISMMLGHAFQGKGYGVPVLKAIIEEMKEAYQPEEIYLAGIQIFLLYCCPLNPASIFYIKSAYSRNSQL
ncbi:GNAT family N-acetyltransferase [Neobacillus terrae]|uniref:GNAT family N-acetyltransferase n=1 Tax=Neobacillus terrae TaxID=3034837 RepID=UPI0014080A6A|nr:GNAT family N-acetyltransferase [Neobacillus terrae]NHM32245.1 GNAT family N-acetyltransferase [Neobacillus terrae]